VASSTDIFSLLSSIVSGAGADSDCALIITEIRKEYVL
jgi:hypothetical protein